MTDPTVYVDDGFSMGTLVWALDDAGNIELRTSRHTLVLTRATGIALARWILTQVRR